MSDLEHLKQEHKEESVRFAFKWAKRCAVFWLLINALTFTLGVVMVHSTAKICQRPLPNSAYFFPGWAFGCWLNQR